MTTEKIFIRRDRTDTPFGFKLQGGSDFSIPLSILQITPNSIADRAGLRIGDAIIKINNNETSWMDHSRAKQEIIRAGNEFVLTVLRNAVDTSKPTYTPLAELKSLPAQDPTKYTTPPLKKTDLTVEKEEMIKIGTSHNRAPMQFHKDVGSTIVYQSAKPTNWEPGDYTKWSSKTTTTTTEQRNPTVTAVFHNPYNTPIGLYSDNNVFDAFSHQTKNLMNPTSNLVNLNSVYANNNSQTQREKAQAQVNSLKAHDDEQPKQPKGIGSLSMRMLNANLNSIDGTSEQPHSVFDLKRGYNPTGATVPKGFRSVQAPTLPPPEQRHAPMRKEYQVQHVQQSWLEPKIK